MKIIAMNTKRAVLLAMFVLAAAAGLAAPARAAEWTPAAIDETLAAIADYDSGKPAAPLHAVERMLRETVGNADLRRHAEQGLVRLLERPKADHDLKAFVCQQLAIIGTDASVPALARLLADDETAHVACFAFGRRPSAAVDAALQAALASAKGKALVAVIDRLGDRRVAAATDALVPLAGAADGMVAEAAIVALGCIGTPEASAALTKLRASDDALRRTLATDAALRCAAHLADAGKTAAAAAVYREVLDGADPLHVRRGALLGLAGAAGADAVPALLKTLRGNEPGMKAAAISAVRHLAGEGVTQRFIAELPGLPNDLQVLLIGALVDRGDVAVRPAVEKAAASENAAVRAAALAALGRIGSAGSVALLVRALDEKTAEAERRAAALALRQVAGAGVDAALVDAMKSAAAPAVRAELIQALNERGAASAVPAMMQQAAGGDRAVRSASLKALARLSGPGDLAALVGLLAALEGDDVRTEAEAAVVEVSRRLPAADARADAALDALAKAPSAAAKASLLRVLAALGGDKALDAVRGAMSAGDATVQDAAVRALAAWPDAAPLPLLLDTYRTAASATHRVLALRGAVRLLGAGRASASDETLKAFGDLMALARRPDERKLVLGGLAEVARPEALEMALSAASEDAVRAEAELAALRIAAATWATDPDATKAAMTKLAATSPDEKVKADAAALLARMQQMAGFVAAWQVAGPFREGDGGYRQMHTVAFPPERADPAVAWRMLEVAGHYPDQPQVIDLLPALGGEGCVGYVRTWVHSDAARDARLEFGTDDGFKAWLNGKLVAEKNVAGAAVPGTDKADVALAAGWNAVMLKITQDTGPAGFCLRITDRAGKPLDGLRADPRRE